MKQRLEHWKGIHTGTQGHRDADGVEWLSLTGTHLHICSFYIWCQATPAQDLFCQIDFSLLCVDWLSVKDKMQCYGIAVVQWLHPANQAPLLG